MTRPGVRVRRITPNEWLYLCMEPELPPFAIQLKIQMMHLPSLDELTRAIAQAASANPGARLQARGRWWWDHGHLPRVTPVAEDMPFSLQHSALRRRLPMDLGPPIEVLRWEGSCLVLRCAHALMDAAGLLHFAQDLFRALRGEPLLGSRADLDDWRVLAASPYRRTMPAFKPQWPSAVGARLAAPERGFVHEVRQVQGRVDSPTARIAAALARAQGSGGACRLMIPVDLRLADEGLRTTSNMSNPLVLTFDAALDANACWHKVLGALGRHEQFGVARGAAALRWLPSRMSGRVLGAMQSWQTKRNRHFFTALSSNLARVSLASFSHDGKLPERVGFLPFDTPGVGLNLLTLQHDQALELAASCPAASGAQEKLAALLDEVCAELERGLPARPPSPLAGSARIVIAASFVAEPLAGVLRYWMRTLGMRLEPTFEAYGQVFQALTNPQSAFGGNRDGINAVLLRLEDWCRSAPRKDDEALRERLSKDADDFLAALERFAARSSVPVFVWLAPLSKRVSEEQAMKSILEPLQRFLESSLLRMPGIHALEDERVRRWYPVPQEEAKLADMLGHVPFTPERYAAIASALARVIVDAVAPPFKVIVVDCDNTLWQGACAEDGIEGVVVTEHHRALQAFLVRQIQAGFLVCLCSRNEPADVEAVFGRKDAMVLRLEHIVASRINWGKKSDNLHSLAAELRLGLGSFVFLDDNPVECAEVQAHCPGVQVVRVPADASGMTVFLDHLWGLGQRAESRESSARTQMYQEEASRVAMRAASQDFLDFVESLQLRVDMGPPTSGQWERVAELSRRTSQFNIVPQPRPASYFRSLAPDAHCLAIEVADRFGIYGLTGVLTWRVRENTLYVADWMLSCRVLGRGVEHRVLAMLGDIALRAGCESIEFLYVATARNTPVRAFLESVCERLPPRDESSGALFRLQAQRASTMSPRETATAVAATQEPIEGGARLAAHLPPGVLDLIANSCRDVAQIRSASGDAGLGSVAVAHEDDVLTGLLALARSLPMGGPASAAPDESLIELGMDSLQTVLFIEEAARVMCPNLDGDVFDAGLADFLVRPTLRELASILKRLANPAQA
jgi:FkbH-like protein